MGRVPTSQILQLLQNYFTAFQLYGIWGFVVISEQINADSYQSPMTLNPNHNDACSNLAALTPPSIHQQQRLLRYSLGEATKDIINLSMFAT
jgi:hypothetical protein